MPRDDGDPGDLLSEGRGALSPAYEASPEADRSSEGQTAARRSSPARLSSPLAWILDALGLETSKSPGHVSIGPIRLSLDAYQSGWPRVTYDTVNVLTQVNPDTVVEPSEDVLAVVMYYNVFEASAASPATAISRLLAADGSNVLDIRHRDLVADEQVGSGDFLAGEPIVIPPRFGLQADQDGAGAISHQMLVAKLPPGSRAPRY